MNKLFKVGIATLFLLLMSFAAVSLTSFSASRDVANTKYAQLQRQTPTNSSVNYYARENIITPTGEHEVRIEYETTITFDGEAVFIRDGLFVPEGITRADVEAAVKNAIDETKNRMKRSITVEYPTTRGDFNNTAKSITLQE